MIAGYHLIWTVYGSWLPNDPRGSSSHEIRCAKIAGLGELHTGRRKIQPAGPVIREFYEAAQRALKHDFLTLSRNDIVTIGQAFADAIRRRSYTCYACAIMPDHVHLLIRKHRDAPEKIISELQEAARTAVLEQAERPRSHPVWGGPGWKVYLDTIADMRRVVRYVERNPPLPQSWKFVKPYDGWLPGQVRIIRAKSQARRDT
jgi:REP element-mobilizing transposase RayT